MLQPKSSSNQTYGKIMLIVAIIVMIVVPPIFMKLDAGLRRNDRSSVLIDAARYGDTHFVKSLLIQGVDTNLGDDQGKTALMYAEEEHLGDKQKRPPTLCR